LRKDRDEFEKVEKKKRWNVWRKPTLKTIRGGNPRHSSARITEVLDDDVEVWKLDRFRPNAQRPLIMSY